MVMKENAAKEAGRIMTDEQNEIVKVEFQSYKNYFKYAGGICTIFIVNFIILIFIFGQMYGSYLVQEWAYADPET